ncbi:hypothetical protein M885DRAFT_463385 [Pelagophyceae sp. CCMP2097]|nr:hypothetical protein M885DRAFT_463385 [Pelagophyceae sp. CCMP2097]
MSTDARAAKSKGSEAYFQKDWASAHDHFSDAVRLGKDDADLHLYYSNRSATLQQLGRWDDALEDARAVTALKPDWAKGWQRLGKCLDVKGTAAQARDAFDRAARLDPQLRGPPKAERGAFGTALLKTQRWFTSLDEMSKLALAATVVAVGLYLSMRNKAPPGRPHYGVAPRRGAFGNSGGGGEIGVVGLGAVMLALWKLPPLFGQPAFFGQSPMTLLSAPRPVVAKAFCEAWRLVEEACRTVEELSAPSRARYLVQMLQNGGRRRGLGGLGGLGRGNFGGRRRGF